LVAAGVLRDNQADTECTEFARSFAEKKFMRFAEAAWFVGQRYVPPMAVKP
jgi:hypothetical protein